MSNSGPGTRELLEKSSEVTVAVKLSEHAVQKAWWTRAEMARDPRKGQAIEHFPWKAYGGDSAGIIWPKLGPFSLLLSYLSLISISSPRLRSQLIASHLFSLRPDNLINQPML